MPNIKSAKKRVLIAEKRRLRNKIAKSQLKTVIKKFNTSLNEGRIEDAKVDYAEAIKTIDKSVSKGLLHKNTAARKKSNLSRYLNEKVAE